MWHFKCLLIFFIVNHQLFSMSSFGSQVPVKMHPFKASAVHGENEHPTMMAAKLTNEKMVMGHNDNHKPKEDTSHLVFITNCRISDDPIFKFGVIIGQFFVITDTNKLGLSYDTFEEDPNKISTLKVVSGTSEPRPKQGGKFHDVVKAIFHMGKGDNYDYRKDRLLLLKVYPGLSRSAILPLPPPGVTFPVGSEVKFFDVLMDDDDVQSLGSLKSVTIEDKLCEGQNDDEEGPTTPKKENRICIKCEQDFTNYPMVAINGTAVGPFMIYACNPKVPHYLDFNYWPDKLRYHMRKKGKTIKKSAHKKNKRDVRHKAVHAVHAAHDFESCQIVVNHATEQMKKDYCEFGRVMASDKERAEERDKE